MQVSPPGDWNHPDMKMTNFTVDIAKRFGSAWFKSVPDLKKGAMVRRGRFFPDYSMQHRYPS